MKIVNASYIITKPDLDDPKTELDIYRQIEDAGRTCYKSKNDESYEQTVKFIKKLIGDHHDAMLEHAHMTVHFIVDRGISHEIVRHRLASFAQESTRYCNYSKDKFGNEITVIEPVFFRSISSETKERCRTALSDPDAMSSDWIDEFLRTDAQRKEVMAYARWYESCEYAETNYFTMLGLGCTPQEARSVLPNSLKTELVVTANMREWRHILNLRAAGSTGKPHPQMLEVMVPLLNELKLKLPALFYDISALETPV